MARRFKLISRQRQIKTGPKQPGLPPIGESPSGLLGCRDRILRYAHRVYTICGMFANGVESPLDEAAGSFGGDAEIFTNFAV